MKEMKKKLTLAFSLLLSTALVGCGMTTLESTEEKSPAQEAVSEFVGKNTEDMHLNVGLISSISALPLLVAQEQGYFKEQGIDVDITYFKAAKDRDAALQAGELEGVLCDQIAISTYQNAGLNMQITGKTDGEFVLVAGAQSGVLDVAGLEGKKIGISENTVMEFTLDKLLEKAGLTADAVEKVSIPAMPTRLEMLNSGEIDAALMPSPYTDAAMANGAVALETVDSDSDIYISVTAFNQKVIEEKEAAIVAYYKAYNAAVAYINSHEISEYEEIIISTIGYPESMRGNIPTPVFHENALPSNETVKMALDWSKEKGLLEVEVSPEDVLNNVGTLK